MYNGGYFDTRPRYNHCVCPNGMVGKLYDEPTNDTIACNIQGNNKLNATSKRQTVMLYRKGCCSYFIRSINNLVINITTDQSIAPQSYPCYPDKGHEIKYQRDIGTTGLTLYGMYNNIQIQSESNFVVIVYNGIDDNCKLIFSYLEVKNESNTLPQYRNTTVTEHMTATKAQITTTTVSIIIYP